MMKSATVVKAKIKNKAGGVVTSLFSALLSEAP